MYQEAVAEEAGAACGECGGDGKAFACSLSVCMHSICQRTSAYGGAYVGIRQHTPAYVSIRQHSSAYVSMR
jgi:hypothetical protein